MQIKVFLQLPLLLILAAQLGVCFTRENVSKCSDKELEAFSKQQLNLNSTSSGSSDGYHLTVKEKLISIASMADDQIVITAEHHPLHLVEYQR